MSNEKFDELLRNLHLAQNKNDLELKIKSYVDIGLYHYENEEFQKAKISFENALKLNKNIPEINYHLGLISLYEDKSNNAKNYFNLELEINPNNKDAKSILEKIQINANVPLVTITLLILNLIIFLFTYPKITFIQTVQYALNYETLNIVNSVTSLFFHANIYHFLVNMTILLMFGIILEKHIGSIRFLFIYLISGIVGNIIQAIFYPNSFILGASAALFGLLGAIIIINPLLELKIFGIIKTPIILLFGGFFAINNLLLKITPEINFNLISADLAHLMGFLSGILIIGIFYSENINIFYNWLLIFFGFWIIEYGIENILQNYEVLTLIYFLVQIIIIIAGIYIIILSYSILKQKILKQEENY